MLRRFLRGRKGFAPSFNPARVLRTLDGGRLGGGSFVEIGRRLHGRSSPVFFCDPSELAILSRRVAEEHPSWRQAALDGVAELRSGLRLYTRTGPPLGPDYPWGALEPGPGDDKLYRKRPHRFAFAPKIALAALYGEDGAPFLEEIVTGWMRYASSRDNRFAYDSNLAVIQRVLALTWSWAFLSARFPDGRQVPDDDAARIEGLLLAVLHEDIRFLSGRLGRSFSNNHLLADWFAGWFIALMWPELVPSGDWRAHYESKWLEELERQTLPDGTSFEHSSHYHEYACEMAGMYVLLSRRNERAIPEWIDDRWKRMLKFQIDLGGTDAFPAAVGDAVEDPLLPLDGGDGWAPAAWRELLRSQAADPVVPAARGVDAAPSVERAFWLLGGRLAPIDRDAAPEPALHVYPDGGFFIFDDPDGSRLTFRTGPRSEMPISAGHAHADWLSVCVSLGDTPVFVDPGTYTYRSDPTRWPDGSAAWRRYFAGPRAHNTVSFQGGDPLGTPDKDFREATVASHVELSRAEDAPHVRWVEAVVRGPAPYGSHRRGVIRPCGEYWIVYDCFPPDIDTPATLAFQCAPETELSIRAPRAVASCQGKSLTLVPIPELGVPVVLDGSLEPLGGWVSRHYGQREPAPQLRFDVPPGQRTTAFAIAAGGGDGAVSLRPDPVGGIAITVEHGGARDTLLVSTSGSATRMRFGDDGEFEGELLWLRARDGKPEHVRWLDGSSLVWPSARLRIDCMAREARLEVARSGEQVVTRHHASNDVSVEWPN